LAITIAVIINALVVRISILSGMHRSLTLSIVITGGITAILFTAFPQLAPLPAWCALVVWAILVIGLYNASAWETPDDSDLLDTFFGDQS
jgi:hypothetical protein